MRTVFVTGAALAVLAVGGGLAACARTDGNAAGKQPTAATSLPPSSPGYSSKPSPSAASPSSPVVVPNIAVVRLSSAFSPSSVRLSTGQQFLLIVSPSIEASGLSSQGRSGSPSQGSCTSGARWTAGSGMLSVRCASGGYLYTAERRGTATISVTVRPHCSPGQMCPQWIRETMLRVSIA